jgi:SAM-dependent methyltransferase
VSEYGPETYGDRWAAVYDELTATFVSPADTERAVARLAALAGGGPALELAIGTGRIAVPLAARGVRVTGVELNARLLERGRAAADKQGVEVEWRGGDMRNLPWEGEFDAALCFSGSFGYFDDDANADFARAVRRTLRPGGRFLIDTHITESLLPILRERDWDEVAETLVLQERRIDHEAGRIDSDWTFVRDGRVVRHPVSIRLYTYRELANLLLGAGFAHVAGYGEDGRPFSVPSSRRLRAVATA